MIRLAGAGCRRAALHTRRTYRYFWAATQTVFVAKSKPKCKQTDENQQCTVQTNHPKNVKLEMLNVLNAPEPVLVYPGRFGLQR